MPTGVPWTRHAVLPHSDTLSAMCVGCRPRSSATGNHAEGLANGGAEAMDVQQHHHDGAEESDEEDYLDSVVTIGEMHVVKELQLSNSVSQQARRGDVLAWLAGVGWLTACCAAVVACRDAEPAQAAGVQGGDPEAEGGAAGGRQEDLPRAGGQEQGAHGK